MYIANKTGNADTGLVADYLSFNAVVMAGEHSLLARQLNNR